MINAEPTGKPPEMAQGKPKNRCRQNQKCSNLPSSSVCSQDLRLQYIRCYGMQAIIPDCRQVCSIQTTATNQIYLLLNYSQF